MHRIAPAPAAAVLLALLAAPAADSAAAQGPPPGLRSRMAAFLTALDELEPMERIASFFPRSGTWEMVRTPDEPWPRAVVGRLRFGPEHTLRAISEGGPVCGSFGGVVGDLGPGEGTAVSQAMRSRGWRYVGGSRFVPPGRGARSPIFVEWRREGGAWVVSRIGEEFHYAPPVLGVWVGTVSRDTTAGAGLPPERRHASRAEWFREHRPLFVRGRVYLKYGLPRALHDGEVERFGSVGVVPVFVERGSSGLPDVLYVLAGPGEYAPYNAFGHSVCRE